MLEPRHGEGAGPESGGFSCLRQGGWGCRRGCGLPTPGGTGLRAGGRARHGEALRWGSAAAPQPHRGGWVVLWGWCRGSGAPSPPRGCSPAALAQLLISLMTAAASSRSSCWEPPRTGTPPAPRFGGTRGRLRLPCSPFPAKRSHERQRQGFLGHLLAISSFHYSWRRHMWGGNRARARGAGSRRAPAWGDGGASPQSCGSRQRPGGTGVVWTGWRAPQPFFCSVHRSPAAPPCQKCSVWGTEMMEKELWGCAARGGAGGRRAAPLGSPAASPFALRQNLSSTRGKAAVWTLWNQAGPVELERIPAGCFLPSERWKRRGLCPKSVRK